MQTKTFTTKKLGKARIMIDEKTASFFRSGISPSGGSQKLRQFGEKLMKGLANPDIKDAAGTASALIKDTSVGLFALTASGLGMKSLINKIQNDTRRKAIIEDLANNDPVLKEAPKQEILEYYAMIYRVAPRLSLEKLAVKELLQNFLKFGRVDIQSLKMIAETEQKISPDTFNLRDMLV